MGIGRRAFVAGREESGYNGLVLGAWYATFVS